MALKTFNIDAKVYDKYSKHCKKKGMSMSRQIENFLRKEIEKMTSGMEDVEVDTKKIQNKLVSELNIEHPLKKYC